jgi:hypothetical protein
VKSVKQFVSNKIIYNLVVMQFLLNCNFLVLVNTSLLRSGAPAEIFVSFYIEENEGDLVNLKFLNFLTVGRQFG